MVDPTRPGDEPSAEVPYPSVYHRHPIRAGEPLSPEAIVAVGDRLGRLTRLVAARIDEPDPAATVTAAVAHLDRLGAAILIEGVTSAEAHDAVDAAHHILVGHVEAVLARWGVESWAGRWWRELGYCAQDLLDVIILDASVNPGDVCRAPVAHLDLVEVGLVVPPERLARWDDLVDDVGDPYEAWAITRRQPAS